MARKKITVHVDSPLVTDVPVQEVDSEGNVVKTYPSVKAAKEAFTVVTGGDEEPQSVSAGKTIGTLVSSVPGTALLGGSIAGPIGALAGAVIGGGIAAAQIASANQTAYDNWLNQERKKEVALTPYKDEATGRQMYKIDYEKMAEGNKMSGEAVKAYQTIPETDTPVTWGEDGHLKIQVSPIFAESQEYQDVVKEIKESVPNLTKENDTDGAIVSSINSYVKDAQSNYFYNTQAAAKFEVAYPGASAEAISTAIANQKIGYYDKDDLDASYNVVTLTDAGTYSTITAKELFDTVKGLDEADRNTFLEKLYTQICDNTLPEDKRAVAQGELNAIYAASGRENSQYTGMVTKSFWNYVAADPVLMGFSVSDIASIFSADLERDYFLDDDATEVAAALATTPVNILSSITAMNKIESGLRALPGLRNLSAMVPAGKTLFTTQEALVSLGFNLGADAIYDLAKLGISEAMGRDMDYWKELGYDLAIDLIVTYASSAAFKTALYRRGIKSPRVGESVVMDEDGTITGIGEVISLKNVEGENPAPRQGVNLQEAEIVTETQGVKGSSAGNNVDDIYSPYRNAQGEVDFGESAPVLNKMPQEIRDNVPKERLEWNAKMVAYGEEKTKNITDPEEKSIALMNAYTEFEKANPAPEYKEGSDWFNKIMNEKNLLVDSENKVKFSEQQNLTRGEVRKALYQQGYDKITNKQIKADIDKADSNFTQRMTSPVVFYRGETSGTNRDLKVGDKLDTSSYTYLAVETDYTDIYRNGATGGKTKFANGGYLYRYHLKSGQPVYWGDISLELILPRDVEATVTSIKKDIRGVLSPSDNPFYIVDVEVNPNSGVTPKLTPIVAQPQAAVAMTPQQLDADVRISTAAQKLSQEVYEVYGDLTDNNAIRKAIQLGWDKNIALRKVGYDASAKSGNLNFAQKISNYAQNSYALEAQERQNYYKIVPDSKQHVVDMSVKLKNVLDLSGSKKLTDAQNNYLIAKQMLSRISQEQKGQALKNAEAFYKPWLEAVDGEEKIALDELYSSLSTMAGDALEYEIKRGTMSVERSNYIQTYKGWFPVYSAQEKPELGFAISRDRLVHKKYNDKEVVISPEGFLSPYESTWKYIGDAIQKAAFNNVKAEVLNTLEQVPDTTWVYEIKRKDESTGEYTPAVSEILSKYKVPKKIATDLKKHADTPSKYKEDIQAIFNDNKLVEIMDNYFAAKDKPSAPAETPSPASTNSYAHFDLTDAPYDYLAALDNVPSDGYSTIENGKSVKLNNRREYFQREKGIQVEVYEIKPSDYPKIILDNSDEDSHYKTLEDMRARTTGSGIDMYASKFENGEKVGTVSITFNEDGKYADQEGFHRTYAADKVGDEAIPVIIVSRSRGKQPKIKYGKKITDEVMDYLANREAEAEASTDPLQRGIGDYSGADSTESLNAMFKEDMETAMEGALADANRRNNTGYKISEGKALYKFMDELEENLGSMNQQGLAQLVNETITTATPYVHYNELLFSYVKSHSKVYREEILSKEEIKSGKSAYNIATGEEVTRGEGYEVPIYIGGEKQTLVLGGPGAEEVASILNSKMQPRQQNILLRGLGSFLRSTAQLKRMGITGLDWTRVAPNLARDASRGIVSTGGDIIVNPNKALKWLVDSYNIKGEELQKIYDAIDLYSSYTRQSTTEQTLNNMGRVSQKEMSRLAEMPEAPSTGALAEMTSLQRFGAKGKYMFNVFTYDLRHGKIREALETPGDFAEAYTRTRAANNAFTLKMAERLEQGATVDEAIKDAFESAAWSGRVSTTSFGTKGTITEWLAKFAPYSFSSFSSAESFAEAFAADPVGVGSKLFEFLTAYTLAIAITLSDEESRKNYYNLTDYDKGHNLIIPIDSGAIITIPIDDWLGGFISPYRALVETINAQDGVTFWKIFGAFLDRSSVDLSGFTEGDRFNFKRGIEKLIDAYAPAAITAGAETATGYDLYYGEDNSVDLAYLTERGLPAETPGDYTTKSNNSKTLYALSNILGIPQWRLQTALNSTGNMSQYALYLLDKLIGATDEETGGKSFQDAIYKPFTGMDSNNVTSAFYDGMDILQEKKAKLMNQLNVNVKAQKTASGDELVALKLEYDKKVSTFVTEVGDWVNKYLSAYELTGGLTRSQASQIFYLFDFTSEYDNVFEQGTVGGSEIDEALKESRKQATALSADILGKAYPAQFGSIYKKSDGSWEYSSSYGEQAFENAVSNRTSQALVNIESAITKAGLSSEYYDKIQPLADKYYQTKNYDALNKLYAEWDVKVMKTIAPTIDLYGVSILDKSKVIDYLDNFIRVPSDYEVNNRGRYFSASRLNKQRGFAQSYAKYLYNKMRGNK